MRPDQHGWKNCCRSDTIVIMRALHGPIVFLGMGLLLEGCFLPSNTVVTRFSGEFKCPEPQVKIEQLDKERFRAAGCNRRATYRCTGEYRELCERQGQPETINPVPPELPEQEAPLPPPG